MPRIPQPAGTKGSLKWIQRAVDERWPSLEAPLLARLPGATTLDWRSPLRGDGWAEYRDEAFLGAVGLAAHAGALAAWWPRRGPQWDALAVTDAGQVVLVEAKAHIDEFCSPGSSAGPESRERIDAALAACAAALGARGGGSAWSTLFYQHANRLAHLHFLRLRGVDAYLALVGFVGDAEVRGPTAGEVWPAAVRVAEHALGLSAAHPLARYTLHVHPDVREFAS